MSQQYQERLQSQTGEYKIYFVVEEAQNYNFDQPCQNYQINVLYQNLAQYWNISNFYISLDRYTSLNPNDTRTLSELGYQPNSAIYVMFRKLKINLYIDNKLSQQEKEIFAINTINDLKNMIDSPQNLRSTLQKKAPLIDYENVQIYFGNNKGLIFNFNEENWNKRILDYCQQNTEINIKVNSFQGLSRKFRDQTVILDNFTLQMNDEQNIVYYKTLKPFELSGYAKRIDAKSNESLQQKNIDWHLLNWVYWNGQNDIRYSEIHKSDDIDSGFMVEWDSNEETPRYSVITLQTFGYKNK